MNEIEMLELDAWIAEHVMGWQWWRFNSKTGGESGKWCQLVPPNEQWPHTKKEWGGVLCKCQIEGMENGTDLSAFKPTEIAADAMAVLEKCAEKTMVSCWRSKRQTLNGWVVDNRHHQGLNGFLESAETLSLAICLFAKKLFS